MQGIPKDLDGSFLLGSRLIQMRFGEHELILNFDNEASILIMSELSLHLPASQIHQWEDFRQGAGYLVALISDVISACKVENKQVLALEFQTGSMLRLIDNSVQFESIVITHLDKRIVI